MDLATRPTSGGKPAFSIVSIISIICALASFHYGAGLGFLLAIVAIALGAIGALMAVLPGTRGGILSIVAVIAGGIGIIAAIFKLIGHLL